MLSPLRTKRGVRALRNDLAVVLGLLRVQQKEEISAAERSSALFMPKLSMLENLGNVDKVVTASARAVTIAQQQPTARGTTTGVCDEGSEDWARA